MWLLVPMLLASTSAHAQVAADTGWLDDTDPVGAETGAGADDTDCRRADTSDTDIEDCSDAVDDTDTTPTSSGTYTAGELIGETGGPACASSGSGQRLGALGFVGVLGLVLSRTATRRR